MCFDAHHVNEIFLFFKESRSIMWSIRAVAEAENAWSSTSDSPACLYGVNRVNFTLAFLNDVANG